MFYLEINFVKTVLLLISQKILCDRKWDEKISKQRKDSTVMGKPERKKNVFSKTVVLTAFVQTSTQVDFLFW
jgi:hypothetical protein